MSGEASGAYWQVPGERPGDDARRHWYRAGGWELERVRSRLPPGRPRPPWREPSAGGDIVRGIVAKFGLADTVALDALRADWPAIVGEDLARHCRPAALEGDTLVVGASGGVWMFELRRQARTGLLAAVRRNGAGRDVRRIVVRPGA